MSFDPTKPANNSPNSSAEMRAQLTALFYDQSQMQQVLDKLDELINALRR